MNRRALFLMLANAVGALKAGVLPKTRKYGLVDGELNPFACIGTCWINGKDNADVFRCNDVQGWADVYVRNGKNYVLATQRPGPGQWVRNRRIVERIYGDVRIELRFSTEFFAEKEWLRKQLALGD